jgi:hypothetical protein
MADSPDAPVFADRYRFESVDNDWDKGRSGFTHLVYDLELKRLGVIKRAEIISKPAVEGLKREVEVLKRLKGPGVPEVYETGETIYGSKAYLYIVIECIDALRVEKKLGSLTKDERVEILTQLFGLLAKAHQMGIANGDVDLKHLFWRRDQKQLVVIDWGNAKLGIDPQKKPEFAYDLARSAEIIYSLITGRGHPSATGSVALPSDASLIRGIAPIPAEFRQLCKWAPRTPSEGLLAPYTAAELFEVSKKWSDAVHHERFYQPPPPRSWQWMLGAVVLLALAAIALAVFGFPYINGPVATSPPAFTLTEPMAAGSTAPTFTETPLASPTATIATSTTTPVPTTSSTAAPAVSPVPRTTLSGPILLLDNTFVPDPDPEKPCWENTTNVAGGLIGIEGLSRRVNNDHYWRFGVEKGRTPEDIVQTYFTENCLKAASVKAIGMDVSILQLEAGREFGLFLEDSKGNRREYTILVQNIDNADRMYLRVRDNSKTTEYEQLIDHLKVDRPSYLRTYYQLSLQIFLEIDNEDLDVIYLREGALQVPVEVTALDPGNMKLIDPAVLPTMSNITKIGLIGHGGEMQVAIWPLAFMGH